MGICTAGWAYSGLWDWVQHIRICLRLGVIHRVIQCGVVDKCWRGVDKSCSTKVVQPCLWVAFKCWRYHGKGGGWNSALNAFLHYQSITWVVHRVVDNFGVMHRVWITCVGWNTVFKSSCGMGTIHGWIVSAGAGWLSV